MDDVIARKVAAKSPGETRSRSRSQRGSNTSHAERDGKAPARVVGSDAFEERLRKNMNADRRRPDRRHSSYSLPMNSDNANGSDVNVRKEASESSSRETLQQRSRRRLDKGNSVKSFNIPSHTARRSDAGARNMRSNSFSRGNLSFTPQEQHESRREAANGQVLSAPASRPRLSRRASERF